MSDDAELKAVVSELRGGYDMLPFLDDFYAVEEVEFQPMPADMKALISSTPDYRSPDPGEGPVWLQIASGDDAAELVVYRSRGSGILYVIAPTRHGA